MSLVMRRAISLLVSLLVFCMWAGMAAAQSGYTAQLSGVVTDSSGAIIPGAKLTLTDEATGISMNSQADTKGIYVFTGIRPGNYTIRVEAPDLAAQERKGVRIGVSQQATLDFTMSPSSISETVSVSAQAPLLDTANASLGTDVTNEYVRDIPLPDRSFFGLVFLSGGVTETAGQGTADSYPTGTNFVSNGQRNATAEIRVDGALTSAPEQGEGATSNVYYQPSVEIVQEFKVENNSFSAEFGNNGGTVVNIVLKEGGNQFHGSGWWFGQRSAMDANDFFNNAQGIPKPDHSRDQYGFSLGGPIRKEKTFFFVDFERVTQNDPVEINAFVPTDAERSGDFRNTYVLCTDPTQGCNVGDPVQQHIYNPFSVDANGNRADFAVPNVIDSNLIDSIGQKIISLYPEPTIPDAAPGTPNFHKVVLSNTDGRQLDVKIDHHFNDMNKLSARFSNLHSTNDVPTVFGDGDFNDGYNSITDVYNSALEYDWSPTSNLVWTNRFAIDRAVAPVTEDYPKLDTVFTAPGDAILSGANGLSRMPVIQMDNNATSLYNQCCTDTSFAHTLYSYSSSLSWVHGRHIFKFGGEQRIFFNNFFQPNPPTGFFHFTQNETEQVVGAGNSLQGNSFASLLLGYGDPGSSSLSVFKSVANKSKETAFYVQDDWKLTPKLTVNLGLRYEWSTPYTERNNLIQFSDFTGDSGVNVPIDIPGLVDRTGNLAGTTVFPTSGNRNIPVDRNNIAPRVGFAYSIDDKTVVRGGAGIYYGMNVATNFQFTGTAFGNSHSILFSKDNFQTQFASLENPFPNGYALPQGTQYGALALWGFPNNNSLDTGDDRNAEIYQWNLGVQHLFPGGITIGIDYSASRSTHLPYSSFSGTANRNYLPSSVRNQIVSQYNTCIAGSDPENCVTPSNTLANLTDNPFASLFTGQDAIFNQPESIYNDNQIPLINLLRPFPQFDGPFSGLTLLAASAWYNSLQVRFQKRAGHYISFEGNYTFSKATDNSSAGANSFITTSLSSGIPQEYDNLKAENSISANDATHRFVLATIVDVPVGRGRWIGRDMNRVLDGIVGGWSISTIVTFQTGTPISIMMASPRLADGNQRPNVVCGSPGSGFSYHQAAANGQDLASGADIDPNSASVFNANCFADPGDQVAGNAPRYFSNLRGDGIHNADLSFSKEFLIREGMRLQIRGEFFNFTNTPRFNFPDTLFGDSSFGQVTSTLNSPRHTQIGVRFEF
ncbi:MAG TPA: TonB-dependent receptor [Candidatus Eisenbacteria bacterium]|nr:TonB-dependent receptor [Candidatus Eisenbacteria bacterium]